MTSPGVARNRAVCGNEAGAGVQEWLEPKI